MPSIPNTVGEISRSEPPCFNENFFPFSATTMNGHGVGGVGGVRTARCRVDHHLGVAVVGRDQQRSTFGADRGFDPAQTGINGFDGLDRRLNLPGVSHHVGVGKIDDDDIEGSVFDSFDDGVGNAGSAHLRLQVVGSNFG